MTTKTTKISIVAVMAVATILLGVTALNSEAVASNSFGIGSGSKVDRNIEEGLPYIDKSIVTSDLSIKASNSVTMELTLMNAPAGAYVVLEPITSNGGFVTDSTLTREQVFDRVQQAQEGQLITGIVQKKDLISFENESIILRSGQPTQFTVTINLSDTLIKQNPHSLTFNVGFDQVKNVGVDKLPIKTGGITLEGPEYEQ